MKRVVVGMSGGIDSFVTALFLQQKGYEVVGVTLELWERNEVEEVEALCSHLGMKLITQNGRELFRQMVVQPFIEGYLSGLTPSPCCVCNSYVKWELLRQAATDLGAEYIATGHYVRIVHTNDKYYIRKGVDSQKDQSYFLWGVPQEILARALFPLGDYTKAEVKAWAMANGYEQMTRKKESMGVCFLKGNDYRDFIQKNAGNRVEQKRGAIINRKGKEIGTHQGLLNYTVGQKRGMPYLNGQFLYVAEINTEQNILVADIKSGLYTMSLVVNQVKVVSWEDLFTGDISIKIRGIGLNPGGFVKMEEYGANSLKVYLSEPAWAIAPGQPVAFYREDILLGGGIAME
ncbi:MAG: tRNA 2-thiouridine(34) synthase MnmA [Odoribacter sp.]